MDPQATNNKAKQVQAAHAKALESWLEERLQELIPPQDRLMARCDPKYVRAFCRAKKLKLAQVGNTLNYVLLQKRKIIAKFVFQVTCKTEDESIPENSFSKN